MTKGLKKMFDRRGAQKKKQFSGPVNLTNAVTQNAEISPRRKSVYTEGQKRRAHQVGRVLYDNIVHLVNSGELCPQLAAMSVEIVQVKVVPNFSAVNVYWLTSGTEEDEIVEQLFKEREGLLRQMLTSQHILGVIPRINFVRDNSQAHYLEVESLLSKADFGPDFVSTRLDTSVRDVFLKERLKDRPDSDQLQVQDKFHQMSVKSTAESSEFEMTTAGRKVLSDKTDSGEVNNPPQNCQSAAEKESVQASNNVLKSEPSFMEVGQLHSQLISKTSVASSMGSVSQLANYNVSIQQNTDSVCKGFRDDLYGVPHTHLLNKVLLRKQKAGTRPAGINREKEAEKLQLKLEPKNLKALLQKKPKTKGRHVSQSDFVKAGIENLSETQRSAGVQAEELSDDDFEEDVFQTSDDSQSPK